MFDLFDASSDRALHGVDEAQNNIEKWCVHVQMYVKQSQTQMQARAGRYESAVETDEKCEATKANKSEHLINIFYNINYV